MLLSEYNCHAIEKCIKYLNYKIYTKITSGKLADLKIIPESTPDEKKEEMFYIDS